MTYPEMDFTIAAYKTLLNALKIQGFSLLNISEFLARTYGKTVILRHDVDRLPQNSLEFAKIQANLGIRGTYYFRAVPESWDESIVRKIAEMGHEIGYHYEDMSFAQAKLKVQDSKFKVQGEDFEQKLAGIGIKSFSENLEKLRKIVPVKTICMHGSPTSRWDSRLLWKYYNYRDFGIIGEPYFDVDFDEVMYLTDTGRRWDGDFVSVRDKAQSTELRAQGENPYKDWKVKPVKYRIETKDPGPRTQVPEPSLPAKALAKAGTQDPEPLQSFHSTFDIIKAANEGRLPDKIMMTFHPQRWTDKPVPWVRELVWQNVKNTGKYLLVSSRK